MHWFFEAIWAIMRRRRGEGCTVRSCGSAARWGKATSMLCVRSLSRSMLLVQHCRRTRAALPSGLHQSLPDAVLCQMLRNQVIVCQTAETRLPAEQHTQDLERSLQATSMSSLTIQASREAFPSRKDTTSRFKGPAYPLCQWTSGVWPNMSLYAI